MPWSFSRIYLRLREGHLCAVGRAGSILSSSPAQGERATQVRPWPGFLGPSPAVQKHKRIQVMST